MELPLAVAFHRDNPIYIRDLEAYRRDSQRTVLRLHRRRAWGDVAEFLQRWRQWPDKLYLPQDRR
jgi:hypothetical protein